MTKDLAAPPLTLAAAFCLSLALTAAACRPQPGVALIGIGLDQARSPADTEVANDEIQSLKEFDGFRVRFIRPEVDRDPVSRLGTEVAAANHLAKIPGLTGMVGHEDSRMSLLTAPIYNEARVPQLVPTGTSSALKRAGPWTFMLAPDDAAEGTFIGQFVINHLRARTATIFYQLDEYGRGLRDGVVKSLAEGGVGVIDQVAFDWLHNLVPGLPEFDFPSLVAASLRRGTPEVVIIAGRSREAGEIARLFHVRAPGTQFIAGDGVQAEPLFIDAAGPAVGRCFLVSFWHDTSPDAVSRAFVQRFRRLAGRTPHPGEALLHDGLMLLAHAAREAGASPAAVRRYLTELGRARPPYPGVTGPITFAENRPARLLMTRIEGRAAALVETN